MDFMELLVSLSWRGILMAVVVLLVFYILFIFLSISRLRRGAPPMPELSPGEIRKAVRSYAAVQEPEASKTAAPKEPADAAQPARDHARKRERERASEPEPASVRNAPPAEGADPARIGILEEDLSLLRREIGGLRAEIRALREERREADKARTVRDTSPFYSDAMQLAAQGRDAADISAVCGISRAEAELVVALARNEEREPE
jgi:hypothetical protein